MNKSNKSELFELLLKNDENELKKFILSNGKRKAVCPIRFHKQEKKEREENGK